MKRTAIISTIVFSLIGYTSARSIVTLITQSEQRRVGRLKWFQPYLTDGELLRHPKAFLFGAFDNDTGAGFRSILTLGDSLRTALPLIHIYTAWGSKPEEEFPAA